MNNKNIIIIDDFLSKEEWEKSNQALAGEVWRYGWPREPDLNSQPSWHIFVAGKNRPKELSCLNELNSNEKWKFLTPTWQRIKNDYMPEAELRGIYVNGHTYGIGSKIHRDSRNGEHTKTALIFLHGFWASSWGGEICFYQKAADDLIKSILPKSNRLIVFDGDIPHNVRSPSADCNALRISIAFKTHIKSKKI